MNGWRVFWQDWTCRRIGMGDPLPDVFQREFPDRASALAYREHLRAKAPDVAACIAPVRSDVVLEEPSLFKGD